MKPNSGILFKMGTWYSQIGIGDLAVMKHQNSIIDAVLDIAKFGDVAPVHQKDLPGIPTPDWNEAIMVELKKKCNKGLIPWHPAQI